MALAVLTALPSAAQSFNLDFGEGGQTTGRIVQLIALLTVLSLAPSIIVMVTSFTRIVVVLALLRSAMGTQGTPPNVVLISLALFLTAFVMAPTFEVAYRDGIAPLIAEEIDQNEAFERTMGPVHHFMLANVREHDLRLLLDMAEIEQFEQPEETPLRALIPAFMISELKRAFEIASCYSCPS